VEQDVRPSGRSATLAHRSTSVSPGCHPQFDENTEHGAYVSTGGNFDLTAGCTFKARNNQDGDGLHFAGSASGTIRGASVILRKNGGNGLTVKDAFVSVTNSQVRAVSNANGLWAEQVGTIEINGNGSGQSTVCVRKNTNIGISLDQSSLDCTGSVALTLSQNGSQIVQDPPLSLACTRSTIDACTK
jgi:hypothetical protein